MKVLHVIDTLSMTGGAEQSLAAMLPLLRDRGVDGSVVCLFHRDGPTFDAELRDQGFAITTLGDRRLPRRAARLRRLVRGARPDLVHASLIEATFATRLALIGSRVPQVDSLVSTTYDPVRIRVAGIDPRKLAVIRRIDAASARLVTGRFHALTQAVRDEAVDVLGVPARRVSVIPRGRDAQLLGVRSAARRDAARAGIGAGPGDLVILHVGRQEPPKAHTDLVEAFTSVQRRVPEALLVLAGRDGAATPAVHAAVQRSPARHRVRLLGHRSDVADLLSGADVFAFPSLYEGLGGSLIEAMAMSCPIVGSDAPAVAEVLGWGEYGRVVPRSDPAALADALVALLRDPGERARLGRVGRARFDDVYELGRVVDAMHAMYRDVLAQAPR